MNKKLVTFGLILVFLTVSFSGCTDSGELDELNSDYSKLQSKYNLLESNFTRIQKNYADFLVNYTSINSSYNDLLENYTTLKSEFDYLNNSYNELLNTYEIYNADLYTEIPFEISLSSGDVYEEKLFDIGYGIIIKIVFDVKIRPSSYYIWERISWTRDGESGNLGATGIEYQQLPSKLNGVYFCEIYDDGGSQISVEAGIRSNQSSWSGRTADGFFPKEL